MEWKEIATPKKAAWNQFESYLEDFLYVLNLGDNNSNFELIEAGWVVDQNSFYFKSIE